MSRDSESGRYKSLKSRTYLQRNAFSFSQQAEKREASESKKKQNNWSKSKAKRLHKRNTDSRTTNLLFHLEKNAASQNT